MAGKKSDKPPLLALVGPTAVGKSDLAMHIAPKLKAEIICADSAQIYRRLDIGTAKPTTQERAAVPHHLFDLVEPDCDFSVAAYQRTAAAAIEEVLRRRRLPLLVGGTGLYIKALTDAYAFGTKGKDEAVRARLNREAGELGLPALYRRLEKIDPAAALKIHPNDRRRIVRALEFYELEGRPISEQVEQTGRREEPYNLLIFGLSMPRQELYRRIELRVEKMIAQGFVEEVKGLLKDGFAPNCPGLKILGYRELVAYLQGLRGWEDTIEEIKKQTRRLAKRQFTWFRRDPRIIWLEVGEGKGPAEAGEIIYRQVKEKIPVQANSIT